MEIMVLIDNIASKPYIAQHGLSLIIKHNDKKILFDTGQDPFTLRKNLETIKEKDNFDSIVISHGHYDHTDGLQYFINKRNKSSSDRENKYDIPIYIHPEAFVDRYSRDKRKYIGINKSLKKHLIKENLIFVENNPYFEGDMIISGKVERIFPYEEELFYILTKDNNYKIDPVNDDMFIIVDGVVITGCAHSGIINVMEYAKKINKNKKIRGVIGGFHLTSTSKEYLDKVYNYFSKCDLEVIMPLHCTGFNALNLLSTLDNFLYGHVGKKLIL